MFRRPFPTTPPVMARPASLLATLTALLALASSPAFAAWSSTGALVTNNTFDEQPGYSFFDIGSNIAPDMDGGVFVAWTFPTSGDSIRLNRIDGMTGARAWGANGVKINEGGNAAGPAHVVSDGFRGCWVVWSDSRATFPGLYCQSVGHDGTLFSAARVTTSLTSSGDTDVDAALSSDSKLLVAWYENGVGLKVQKLDQFANSMWTAGGVLVTTDDDPFPLQLMSDGAGGAVVVWESARATLPGTAGHSKIVANRVNSSGAVQWGAEGSVVQAGTGVTATETRAVWDGTSLFVSWKHVTAATSIHAQKLNGSGVAQWGTTAAGVKVMDEVDTAFDRNSSVTPQPRVVSDGAGGILVCWVDARDYDRPGPNGFPHAQDIYGQRLNGSGATQWNDPGEANGAAIDSITGTQEELQITSDLVGGATLVYTDLSKSAGSTQDDIQGRRIDGNGATLWHAYLNNGTPADGEQFKPRIAGDAAGGAFFVWEDHRDDATTNSDVYLTHRTRAGSTGFPAITVTFPNGGQSYVTGEVVPVTWTSNYGYLVDVTFDVDGVHHLPILPGNPTFDDGAFNWTVGGGITTTQARINVSDHGDGIPTDSSDVVFTVCSNLSSNFTASGLNNPNALASGDFNEDGILDLAVGTSDSLYIFRGLATSGLGNGRFTKASAIVLPGGGRGVAVGDFNGDGRLDLAVSCSSGVAILLGLGSGSIGNGSFAAPVIYGTGTNPNGVAIQDFNEDGILDLAVANSSSNNVSILLGNGSGGVGNGTFAAAVNYATQSTPAQIAIADFNSDGRWDLAVTNNNGASNSVSILLGNGSGPVGNGTFAAAVNDPAGQNPWGIATGDFNSDGITDLAIGSNTTTGVEVLVGNGSGGIGNGTFAPAVSYLVGGSARAVAVADFNKDGRADIMALVSNTNSVVYLFGDGTGTTGDGTFTVGGSVSQFTQFPTAVVLGDFQEDGMVDAAMLGINSDDLEVYVGECAALLPTAVTVTSPNGGEGVAIGTERTITWTKGAAVMAVNVELSRDGGLNWETLAGNLTGTSFNWTVVGPATSQARIRVTDSNLWNRTDISDASFSIGNPTLTVTSPNGGETVTTMSLLPINWTSNAGGNVKLEVALVGQPRQTLTASTPNNGSFLWLVPNGLSGPGRAYVTSLSFPSVTDSSNLTFDFCTRLAAPASYPVASIVNALAAGDVNGDGITDIVAAAGGYRVMLGNGTGGVGDGSFTPQSTVSLGVVLADDALVDLNDDGILDLVVARGPNLAVLLGNGAGGVGNGTFGAPTNFPAGASITSLVVGDFNEDGIEDVATAESAIDSMMVFIGQGAGGIGTGSFAPRVSYPTGDQPSHVVTGDFNEDGIPDLAVACPGSGTISVFIGQGGGGVGSGAFAPQPTLTSIAGAKKLAVGDFNQDGRLDLIAMSSTALGLHKGNGSGSIGNGTFAAAVTSTLPHSGTNAIAVANFALDEFPDLVVGGGAVGQASVLFNDAGDTFQTLGDFSVGSKTTCLITGDFNQDGSLDIATGQQGSEDVTVVLGNDCDGSFPGTLITVTSPNGGETLPMGVARTITFSRADQPTQVDVEISRDNGRHWETIAHAIQDLSFTWNVVGPPTDSALVRVHDSAVPTWADVSDAPFHINNSTTAVGDHPTPAAAAFSRPYPNPSRGDVRFEMSLTREADVSVEVFDVNGRRVSSLASGRFSAGVHQLRWSSREATQPGLYFVHARWEGADFVQRVVRIE